MLCSPPPPLGGGGTCIEANGVACNTERGPCGPLSRRWTRRKASSRSYLCGFVAVSALVVMQFAPIAGGPGRPSPLRHSCNRHSATGLCALMPSPPSAELSRTPSVAPDRWPLPGASVSIMPEAVERPLDKYLQKYDEHYKRVVPDWFLQYKTLEQQYLYEGDFSVFVRELTDEGAIVQDVVTGVVGFVPMYEFGPVKPSIGSIVDGARCTSMDYTVITSPSVEGLRMQTGIVWEWDEQAGEGYILPTEEQEAWRMIRVLRRDVQWHDSYRLFVGQFVQFETVFHDEVPIQPNDERGACFALRVRSPEVIFSFKDAHVDGKYTGDGQLLSLTVRGAPLSSVNSLNPRIWRRDAPIPPESGRPEKPQSQLQLTDGTDTSAAPQLSQHPALARWAATDTMATKAESPAWLWEEQLGYVEDDIEDYPIVPLETMRATRIVLTERVLAHEVAVERGDEWKEPAFRKGRKQFKKQQPPGRRLQELMTVKAAEERAKKRKAKRRAWKLRAAELQRQQYR